MIEFLAPAIMARGGGPMPGWSNGALVTAIYRPIWICKITWDVANASSGCNVGLFLWDAYGCFVLHTLVVQNEIPMVTRGCHVFLALQGKYRSSCGGAGLLIYKWPSSTFSCFISGLEHDPAIPHSWIIFGQHGIQQMCSSPLAMAHFQSNILGGWHVR